MKVKIIWKLEVTRTLDSSDIGDFEGDDESVLEKITKAAKDNVYDLIDFSLIDFAGSIATIEVIKV